MSAVLKSAPPAWEFLSADKREEALGKVMLRAAALREAADEADKMAQREFHSRKERERLVMQARLIRDDAASMDAMADFVRRKST